MTTIQQETSTTLISPVPNAIPYILRLLAIKPAKREKEYLTGDDVPNIDVLITTCNEDVHVVMDTIRAACVLDYPTDKYRIFVCDDGASKPLRTAVEAHALQHTQLHYTARIKGPVKDYKAGNLNAGLSYSGSLHPLSFSLPASKEGVVVNEKEPESPRTIIATDTDATGSTVDLGIEHGVPMCVELAPWGQYVAGLDADMIPEPHWLRTLVPHIDADPKCAMVCPPQVSKMLKRSGIKKLI